MAILQFSCKAEGLQNSTDFYLLQGIVLNQAGTCGFAVRDGGVADNYAVGLFPYFRYPCNTQTTAESLPVIRQILNDAYDIIARDGIPGECSGYYTESFAEDVVTTIDAFPAEDDFIQFLSFPGLSVANSALENTDVLSAEQINNARSPERPDFERFLAYYFVAGFGADIPPLETICLNALSPRITENQPEAMVYFPFVGSGTAITGPGVGAGAPEPIFYTRFCSFGSGFDENDRCSGM